MSSDVWSRQQAEAAKKKKKKRQPQPKPQAAPKPKKELNPLGFMYTPPKIKQLRTREQRDRIQKQAEETFAPPQTTEAKVRAIVDPYFSDFQSLPDTLTTAQIMSAANGPLTEDHYKALWLPQQAAMEAEQPYMKAGDFGQVESGRGWEPIADSVIRVGKASPRQDTVEEKFETPGQAELADINRNLQYVRRFNRKYGNSVSYVSASNEYLEVKHELANRARAQGLKPKWDENSTEYDPRFEMEFRKYMFARQFAFACFGTPEEQAKANSIIAEIVKTGMAPGSILKSAKRYGVDVSQFGPMDTVAGLVDIMRSNSGDTINEVVYDAWMHGRPFKQGEAAARKEYVERFGLNRLPTELVSKYNDENHTVQGILDDIGTYSEKAKEYTRNIPVIGESVANLASVINKADYYVQWPIMAVMQGISTAGLVIAQADYGMSWDEYKQKMEQYGGEDEYVAAGGEGSWGKFSWSDLIDAGNWARSWDEAKGRTPITLALEAWDVKEDGKLSSWSPQVGQLADLGVMIYVGAKVGDPIFYGGMKMGTVGAWKGARVVDKAAKNYWAIKKDWLTSQGGYIRIYTKLSQERKVELQSVADAEGKLFIDPTRPDAVPGLASLRHPTDANDGIMGRIFRRTHAGSPAERVAKERFEAGELSAFTNLDKNEATYSNFAKATRRADTLAREGIEPSLHIDLSDYSLRPLTFSEFSVIEPNIPGLTYFGGKANFDAITARYRPFSSSRGWNSTEDVFFAAEYAHGKTTLDMGGQAAGRRGITYIDGGPVNPMDFDGPADLDFWGKVIDDVFAHERFPEYTTDEGWDMPESFMYHPRVSNGKGSYNLSEKSMELIQRMRDELEWDKAGPDYERTVTYHDGVRKYKGHVTNQEVYRWIADEAAMIDYVDIDPVYAVGRRKNSLYDAVQDNLYERGFDGQTHLEGQRKGIPHKVTVYFQQAIQGRYKHANYAPDRTLEMKARMRLLEQAEIWIQHGVAEGKVPPKLLDKLTESIDDGFGVGDPDFWASKDNLWEGWKYKGVEADAGTFNGSHVWSRPSNELRGPLKIEAEPADVSHIKDSLKNHYTGRTDGPRIISKEEAYERYMAKFNELAEAHVKNKQSPVEDVPSAPKRTAADLKEELVYAHAASENPDIDVKTTNGYFTEENVRVGLGVVDDRTLRLKTLVAMDDAARGAGGRALQTLIDWADEYDIDITLEAAPMDWPGGKRPMSQPELEAYYRKRGFESLGNGEMVRKSRKAIQGGQAGNVTIDLLTGGLLSRWIGKPGAPHSKHTVQPYCPPKMLSTNAELLAKIDDEFTIAHLYNVPEMDRAVKPILGRLARSQDVGEIEMALRELEQHGINIDSGAAAGLKGARLALAEKGMGQLGWTRVFNTMTTYGRMQSMEHASENLFNVGKAIKLGDKTGKRETLIKLNQLARRCYKAEGHQKQNIVDEMWDIFEQNLGDKLDDFKNYERRIYHARGKRYIESLSRRAYHGEWRDGKPGEGSIVVPAGLEKILDTDVKEALSKFNGVHDKMEKDLEKQIANLKKQLAGKRGRGVKGSGALTKLEKDLSDLQRLRTKAIHPDIVQARIDIANLVKRFGGDEKQLERLSRAVADATLRAQKRADAADVLNRLGGRKTPYAKWSKADKQAWDDAKAEMDSFGSAQPFKMGQSRQHVFHRYDPRIAGWYMSGGATRNFMLADQAFLEPLMRLFKETVMASIGFPIRVNVGDELFRLIPEGVFMRTHKAKQTRKQVEASGKKFDEWERQLHEALAGDWDTTGNPDDWHMVLPDDDDYFSALKQDLIAWRNEPIIQRLIASPNPKYGGKGVFPDQLTSVKNFIRYLRDEKSDLGMDMRRFLDDTHRSTERWVTRNGKHQLEKVYNTDAYHEWVSGWEDRLTVLSQNEVFRKAMTGDVSVDELVDWAKQGRNKDILWPVNAPVKYKNNFGLRTGNPLYALQNINPYHYAYQLGTVKLLSAMGSRIKTALFNDRYYTLRNDILKRNPNIDPDELHRVCGEAAARYANQAAYSRSTTMFEDMARNMVPFISAYRQFYVYWAKTVIKHPVSMAVFKQHYPDFMQDPFQFALGDVQYLTPAIPFWGPQDEGESGLAGLLKGQIPSAGFIPATGIRTLAAAMGVDAEQFSDIPGLTSLSKSYAPFKRQGQLMYGLTGVMPWLDSMDSIFGDKEKLERAQMNATLYWMRYGDEKTGAIPDLSDTPWWAKPTEWASQLSGGHWEPKPVALYNELMKTGSPVNAYYSPEPVRERANLMADYTKAVASNDEKAKNAIRAKNPWFDKYLAYYESDAQTQWDMRHDPKNADLLKWWSNPYDYDYVGNFLTGSDWEQNAFANGRDFKSQKQLVSYVHNMYTSIYGGTYIPGEGLPMGVEAGSSYAGDIARAKAEKAYKKKAKDATEWARGVAKAYAAKTGWSYDQLMYKFLHPGSDVGGARFSGWGVWNDLIEKKGLNPYEYNVDHIGKDFISNFGDKPHNNVYKASDEDIQKLMGLMEYMPDPKLRRKLEFENPEIGRKLEDRATIRNQIIEQMAYHASNKWYYLTAEQLSLLGIKADPRINVAQEELKKAWEEWHKLKAGSDEYRNGRNAYYSLQRKMLGNLEGGQALIGGLADRLEHIPYLTKPRTITIGAGASADAQLASWERYTKVRNAEMKKKNPDIDKIRKAWDEFAGPTTGEKDAPGMEQRALEKGRVRMWHTILEDADKYRKILVDSDSDYYKAKGNSVDTKFAEKYVKDLKQMIRSATKVNPRFKEDVDKFFEDEDTLVRHLLDWYNY